MTTQQLTIPAQHRPVRVSAVRDVVLPYSTAEVLVVLRDIELLEPLERKARAVEVHPLDASHGWYHIVGKLFGVRAWEGDFSYQQHESGWHSEDLHPRLDGWRISGGFLLSRIDDHTCRVTHYEDYLLPPRLHRLRAVFALYMRRSQVGEMRDLAELVDREVSASVPAEAGGGLTAAAD